MGNSAALVMVSVRVGSGISVGAIVSVAVGSGTFGSGDCGLLAVAVRDISTVGVSAWAVEGEVCVIASREPPQALIIKTDNKHRMNLK